MMQNFFDCFFFFGYPRTNSNGFLFLFFSSLLHLSCCYVFGQNFLVTRHIQSQINMVGPNLITDFDCCLCFMFMKRSSGTVTFHNSSSTPNKLQTPNSQVTHNKHRNEHWCVYNTQLPKTSVN